MEDWVRSVEGSCSKCTGARLNVERAAYITTIVLGVLIVLILTRSTRQISRIKQLVQIAMSKVALMSRV